MEVEREKNPWTALSIAVSFVAACGTISYGMWSQHEQPKSQFRIKAAEIVLKTDPAYQARDTAKALVAIFPEQRPENFAKQFNPETVPSFGPDIISAKTELLRRLPGKTEEQNKEIINLWNDMFPEDKTFRK